MQNISLMFSLEKIKYLMRRLRILIFDKVKLVVLTLLRRISDNDVEEELRQPL